MPYHCIIRIKIILQLKPIREDMELFSDDKSHLEVSFIVSAYYNIVHACEPCHLLIVYMF
jgi:hypothetical protein